MAFGDDDAVGGGGGSRRLSTTPTSVGRRGDGDGNGDESGGSDSRGACEGRELFISERPRSSSSIRGGGSTTCFFATPECSARNADKENRRAPAWEGVGSGAGGCGLEDGRAAGGSRAGGGRAGAGDRSTNGGGSTVRGVSSSSKSNVARATVASAAAQQPLESSKIRRVARSPATRAVYESGGGGRNAVTSRATSRGR